MSILSDSSAKILSCMNWHENEFLWYTKKSLNQSSIVQITSRAGARENIDKTYAFIISNSVQLSKHSSGNKTKYMPAMISLLGPCLSCP